jgi:hypothetical protein
VSVGGDGYQTGLLIEQNIIHDATQNGMNMDGVGDSTIRNNLIYNVGRYAIHAFMEDAALGPRNLTVINNTFLANSSSKPALIFSNDAGGHILFNNLRVQNGTDTGDPDSTYDRVATYAVATPWFENSTTGDFHLKSGSAPVDAGRSSLSGTDAPALDLEGGGRPAGAAFDQGAYEFGSVPVSDTPTPSPGATADDSGGCRVASESARSGDSFWWLLPVALFWSIKRRRSRC